MATAHPFGAFVGCRFKRIAYIHQIKVNIIFCCVCFLASVWSICDDSLVMCHVVCDQEFWSS